MGGTAANGETILAATIMAAVPGCMYSNQLSEEREWKVLTILNGGEQAFLFLASFSLVYLEKKHYKITDYV